MIANPDRQIEFQRLVPMVSAAEEMVCMWFDDFHPTSELFSEAFSVNEIENMKIYTKTFEKYADTLPNSLEDLLKSSEWELVMKQAKITLHANGWEENAS